MTKCYHISTRMRWNVEPSAEESIRLQRVITSAIRRAIENSTGETPDIVISDFEIHENTSEPFSFANNNHDRGDLTTNPPESDSAFR